MSKKDKTPPANSAKTQAEDSSLPLFFKSPRPLDVARHKQASIRSDQGYEFARHTNSIPLNAIEFIEACRQYPIIFTSGEQSMPAMVVGFEKDNYFVETGGNWKPGRYIPAYTRQYPFVFMEVPQEEKFYLCVDEGAPHFSEKSQSTDANPLYTPDGKPAPLTQNVLDFCTAFYNHFRITREFCADLRKHNLLVPYKSDAKLASGRKVTLSGFLMIDEAAFNALPEKDFMEFRDKGWLPYVYFALASGTNWKRLVDLASRHEEDAAAA